MNFEIVGAIEGIETIAQGAGIREIATLRKRYGIGKWRKKKGFATVRLLGGSMAKAEVHWYEAHGIGKVDFKIKEWL